MHGNGEGERRALQKELQDVRVLKEVFEPKHVRGAVFDCDVCKDKHYLDWDLLLDGLEHTLATGVAPAHEPAADPNPDEYVSWDYARGLLDGYESFRNTEPVDLALHLIVDPSERSC